MVNLKAKPYHLSDADIFKAQFYKFYSKLGKKDEFIAFNNEKNDDNDEKDNKNDENETEYINSIKEMIIVNLNGINADFEYYTFFTGMTDIVSEYFHANIGSGNNAWFYQDTISFGGDSFSANREIHVLTPR